MKDTVDTSDMIFLHCGDCVDNKPDDIDMVDYARLTIGVTKMGDLWVGCERHRQTVEYLDNSEIAEKLQEIALVPCTNPDCEHHKKETMH